jgi:hypothetical protein
MYIDLHVKYQLLLSDFNQIFKKSSNIKFRENASNERRFVQSRQTDIKKVPNKETAALEPWSLLHGAQSF